MSDLDLIFGPVGNALDFGGAAIVVDGCIANHDAGARPVLVNLGDPLLDVVRDAAALLFAEVEQAEHPIGVVVRGCGAGGRGYRFPVDNSVVLSDDGVAPGGGAIRVQEIIFNFI